MTPSNGRDKRRIAEHDLRQLEVGARRLDGGDGERDALVGRRLQRLVAFERGVRLLERRLGDVARVDRAGALGHQRLRAIELELAQRHFRLVADDGAPRGVDVLLGDVELAHPLVEPRLGDDDLLLVVGVVDPGEHRPRLDRLPFVERQFDDAGLHRLEAENAFVRLDVAGDENDLCVWRADPCERDALIPGGENVLIMPSGEAAEDKSRHNQAEKYPPHARQSTLSR